MQMHTQLMTMHDAAARAGRLARLRRRQDAFLQEPAARRMCSPEEQHAAARIARDVYLHTAESVESLRRAEFLEAFAERMPLRVEAEELIVGSMLFNPFRQPRPETLAPEAPWFEGNGGHVVVDYGRVLRRGVRGLRAEVAAMPENTATQGRNKEAFGRVLEAFSTFIRRHARAVADISRNPGGGAPGCPQERAEVVRNCRHLAEFAPETFWQALQLTWFTHVFLHAEASAVAVSFGRFDQFLWPFLERDLDAGTITMTRAEELVACFWLKCCEGDESQNLVLGGCDSSGDGAENPLSLLCLNVTRELRVWQPSVSVRMGPYTSDRFWDASLALCAAGFGMPSFFNDEAVTASLVAAGIPLERARDWGIVGCYEASPQGDCLARTVHGQWVLPKVLLAYLDQVADAAGRADDTRADHDFAAFKQGLHAFMAADYAKRLTQFQHRWDWMSEHQASPFRSLCMTGCCAAGLCAEEAGTRFSLYGVNTLGIGTLVDSLWVLKRLVFDQGALTLAEFREQLAADFPDEDLLAQCRGLPGKYGSDTPESNALAAEFAHGVADIVLGSRMAHGVQPYPALFMFTAWATMPMPATPDGRRGGEPVSYGVGPSVYCTGKTPTSVLKSAAATANDRCGCGNPMLLTLSRQDVTGGNGTERLRGLIETYFREGGYHLHMNILDAADLREAQARPEQHADLLVRISGLSAQFVALDRPLQDGLIARAERGL